MSEETEASARFDAVIVGAGVAGLSLARHLVRDGPPGLRVAVVDEGDSRDHCLALWTEDGDGGLDLPIERRWRQIAAVGADGTAAIRPLREHTYAALRRGTLQAAGAAALQAAGERARRVAGRCAAIVDGVAAARVQVGERWLEAAWVFDGRPPEEAIDRRRYTRLWQRFRGVEVEADEAVFDPAVATLFDFRVPQAGEVRFAYVLPSSPTQALVEVVAIGPEAGEEGLEAALSRYVAETLGVAAPRLRAPEGGASLLSDQPRPRRLGRRICAIGRRGGRLKASTGYALARIERDSAAIARSLREVGHPFALPRERGSLRALDGILLGVLARRPERGAAIFAGLVRRCPADRLLRFLDERPRAGDRLAVIAAVASWVFAIEALIWLRRALAGWIRGGRCARR